MRFVKAPLSDLVCSGITTRYAAPMSDCLDKDTSANNVSAVESRVAKIGNDIVEMKVDIAIIKATFASREDLHRETSALTWRLVTFVCGFGTALVGATYFIAANV